jgi:hypothetical protein
MEGKSSVSVDIDKQLLLKFKSICVLKELTMSGEIEKMVRQWVSEHDGSAAPGEEPPPEPLGGGTSGQEELSDNIEEQVEKDVKL